MATLVAFDQFDINEVDLHWYSAYEYDSALEKNANITANGITYPDLFWVNGYDGLDDLELSLLGSGINQDAFGNIISGTVNLIAEYDYYVGDYLWYSQGISVSAAAIYNAALTPSNADELALIQNALSATTRLLFPLLPTA